MKLFYSLGVNLYTIAIQIAALWLPKARKIVKGRRAAWNHLRSFEPEETVVWFHCASLGEFEQGRPLMEEIKADQKCQIVLTFFSPSGYEVRKNFEGADLVIYLPKDSKRNARKFLDAIQPSYVFFIKYEFWGNYLLTCRERSISTYSVAALFRKDQAFFKWYGGYMRKVLSSFTRIFVQNEASQKLLKDIDIEATVCGDTRFDRVMKNASKVEKYPEIKAFCGDQQVFICGSIWEEDLQVIKNKIRQLDDWKIIIAPHEINERFISRIESQLKRPVVRYSSIMDFQNENILIIDNIGMLMNLYQYGDLAFVGGGYRTGLHNILEPAAFGLPVFFGDKIRKFPEAALFVENKIGFIVPNQNVFDDLFDEVVQSVSKEDVMSFMTNQTGATEKILRDLTSES